MVRSQCSAADSRTFDETIIRADGSVDTDYYGVDTGLYAAHLQRWHQHFPPSQVTSPHLLSVLFSTIAI
jgi:hypothetical protein